MRDWLSERLGAWSSRMEEPPGGAKEPPGGIEGEGQQAYEQRCELQPGRRAWELWFIGRTVTLADGKKRPLLGTYRVVWWN